MGRQMIESPVYRQDSFKQAVTQQKPTIIKADHAGTSVKARSNAAILASVSKRST